MTEITDAEFIKHLEVKSLETDDQCDDAIERIAHSISRIETQIAYAEAEKNLTNEKQRWLLSARAALRQTRVKYDAVVARKQSVLRRWARFKLVLTAKFGAETVRQIWESC